MRARKKPITVDVWQLNKNAFLFPGLYKRPLWVEEAFAEFDITFIREENQWLIQTLEGDMWAEDGDWLIKGAEEELYPCKKSVFYKTYDLLE